MDMRSPACIGQTVNKLTSMFFPSPIPRQFKPKDETLWCFCSALLLSNWPTHYLTSPWRRRNFSLAQNNGARKLHENFTLATTKRDIREDRWKNQILQYSTKKSRTYLTRASATQSSKAIPSTWLHRDLIDIFFQQSGPQATQATQPTHHPKK